MQLCFFSDELSKNFLPLTLTRPVFDLRIGILTIREKWEKTLSTKFSSGIFAEYLHPLFNNRNINSAKDCIWINSRFLPTPELINSITQLVKGEALVYNENIVAAYVNGEISSNWLENNLINENVLNRKKLDSSGVSISNLWDLLTLNGQEICSDLLHFNAPSYINSTVEYPNLVTSNPDQIFVSHSAIIEPGCILVANRGPIYIGENATVEAGSILRGPIAVCENATVKMRARIYDSTTIGPYCKVGGEVANCVFHSYSNKAHDGFVGNSLFGQWCNLGADTNTSNLKNNYSQVRLQDWETRKPSQNGIQFLGTVMGDHSKTAINTMLNTGTICGVSSNIFSSGFPPKYIPSFSWLGDKEIEPYRLEKAVEGMKAMMARRNVEFTTEYAELIKYISEI